MVALKNYPPVGRCIYCATTAGERKLGDEHIIPRTFGGGLLLKEASCAACERLTSGIESSLANNALSVAPTMLGVRGRKSGNVRSRLAVHKGLDRRDRLWLPVGDHPGIIVMFSPDRPPGILEDDDPSARNAAKFEFIEMKPGHMQRLKAIGSMTMHNLGAAPFYRMLAKIAHSYAVAELGYGSFTPLLLKTIAGTETACFGHFIGDVPGYRKVKTELHELGLREQKSVSGQLFLVARVRLFATKNTPTYDIVVGEHAIVDRSTA